MKLIRNLTTAVLLMIAAISHAQSAGPDQTICQYTIATMAATTSTGVWSERPGNPQHVVIDSPSLPTAHISGFTTAGVYRFQWGLDTTYLVITVLAAPSAPLLSQTGFCPGSDSLILSGCSREPSIRWYLHDSLIYTTQFPVDIVAGGNGYGTAANQFELPIDIFIDGSGYIYVSDNYNHRVVKFPPGSTSLTNGVIVAGGNGRGTASNQFNGPTQIFIDASGNLYVLDYGNQRIQKFPAGSSSATNGTTVASFGWGSASYQLQGPACLYVNGAGDIFVSDSWNSRIQKLPVGSSLGSSWVTVAGGNGAGSAANQLSYPGGFFVDSVGNMYVSDADNSRIQKFPAGSNSSTNGITVVGGNGRGSAANQFDTPEDVFIDRAGDMYVMDMRNYRVQKYTRGSTPSSSGVTVAGGNGYGTALSQIGQSQAIWVDSSHGVYVVDGTNKRVEKWTTTSIDTTFLPPTQGVYMAIAEGVTGCSSPESNTIVVLPCLTDSVWPGDADHNGIADNNDLLPLGIGYGLNGFSRPDQSIVWSAHYAQDWGLQFLSGTNAKHADCNGDAVINGDDTTAILTNFGLTHSKTDAVAAYRSGVPAIRLQYSKDTVQQGDTLTVSLLIGDSALPVNNLYGLAFTYHYDALVVDTTTTAFDFVNSFLATSVNGMSISREFKSQGIVKAAVTGINHLNRSGYGKVAQFIATITTGNINGKDLSYYSNINYISDIYAIDKDGDSVALSFVLDSDQVAYEPSGIREVADTRIRLYPNPADDMVTIETEEPMLNEAYTLYDVTGRIVAGGRIHGRTTPVALSDLAPGIYTLQLRDQRAVYKVTKN